MPKRKSAILKVAISLGLTALLLYLFLHNMDFQKAAEAVRGTRLGWLATAFLISRRSASEINVTETLRRASSS